MQNFGGEISYKVAKLKLVKYTLSNLSA